LPLREKAREVREQPLSILWPSVCAYVGSGNIPPAAHGPISKISRNRFTTEEDAGHETKKNLTSQKLGTYLHQCIFDAQLGTELQLLQTYVDFCGITRLLGLSLLATADLLSVKLFFF